MGHEANLDCKLGRIKSPKYENGRKRAESMQAHRNEEISHSLIIYRFLQMLTFSFELVINLHKDSK